MNIHNDNYQNTSVLISFFQYDTLYFCILHSQRQQWLFNLVYVAFTDKSLNI